MTSKARRSVVLVTASVSASKYVAPHSHSKPPMRNMTETAAKATSMLKWSASQPMAGGEMASPNVWMMRMLSAKAVERMCGGVTLARIVLLGPVLKNRQKTASATKTHASG